MDTERNTEGEGNCLDQTDAKVRKRRQQIGLDTLVVYAVNDGYWQLCC